MLAAAPAFGEGITVVEVNGNVYSNISKVHVGTGGRIIIDFPAGGTSASADKLPTNFLASWNIGPESQNAAKAAEAALAEKNLDRAIQAGYFREVDGVVYDIRKPQSGWVRLNNVKVIQITDDGALIDATPANSTFLTVFVKNVSAAMSDTDFVSLLVKPAGTYSYVNKLDNSRTVHAYDVGRACSRLEIPAAVLSGKMAFAVLAGAGDPQTDVVATLPESGDLQASGSGFFVSEDGYLITNNHVVRNARRVKVKTGAGVFSAQVVSVDETNDLALLKISGQFKPLRVSTNDVGLGDAVFTIGFPDIDLQGTQPKYTDGKISSLTGIKDDPKEYQISVQVQPGNSGGPLVDMGGNVHGVIVARMNDFAALRSMGSLPQNVNYAVKGERLRDFLGRFPQVKLRADDSPAGGSAVADVQQSVALILVY